MVVELTSRRGNWSDNLALPPLERALADAAPVEELTMTSRLEVLATAATSPAWFPAWELPIVEDCWCVRPVVIDGGTVDLVEDPSIEMS